MTWAGWILVGVLAFAIVAGVADAKETNTGARVGRFAVNVACLVLVLVVGTGHL